jgi:LytS/YehU family sensor histidine kinase
MPRFYFKKQHVIFILTGILLIILTALLIHSEGLPWSDWFSYQRRSNLPVRRGYGMRDTFSGVRWLNRMIPFIFAFLGSTLVEISWFMNKKEKENLETELKFLKSQVNPHFLFNALNNIYSLAVDQAPETAESVIQLSEILRYMVYDSNTEIVPLENEVKYIENYVNLKILTDPQGMNVHMDLPGTFTGVKIPPLLFIPIVENAFKHSKIENSGTGFIDISLKVLDHDVDFTVVNSLPEHEFTKDKVGGVGLDNIRKRLELLFPGDRHELKISRGVDRFEVNLKLRVK